MTHRQLFKKVLIPCAAGVNAINDGHTYGTNCYKKSEQEQGQTTKPSELPLYSNPCVICKEQVQPTEPERPSGMEEAVGNLRKELWVWQDNLQGYRHKIVDVYRKTISKADGPDSIPKSCFSRNHFENAFNDKCYQAPSADAKSSAKKESKDGKDANDAKDVKDCKDGKEAKGKGGPGGEGPREGGPKERAPAKCCHRDYRLQKAAPAEAPPSEQPPQEHRPQPPEGQTEERPQYPRCPPQPSQSPAEPRPQPSRGPAEHRPQPPQGPTEHRPQPLPCPSDHRSQPEKTHLCEQNLPKSEGSTIEDSCRCCHSSKN